MLFSERVSSLLKSARKYTKTNDFDTASKSYEQAMLYQQAGSRLGLSMILKEYSHFLKKFDEEQSRVLFIEASRIQKDGLNGKFKDDFYQEESFDQDSFE